MVDGGGASTTSPLGCALEEGVEEEGEEGDARGALSFPFEVELLRECVVLERASDVLRETEGDVDVVGEDGA